MSAAVFCARTPAMPTSVIMQMGETPTLVMTAVVSNLEHPHASSVNGAELLLRSVVTARDMPTRAAHSNG
jgi:hypothetical protein